MDSAHIVSISGSPCLSCGACCSFYIAAFYWSEADTSEGGTVPVSMTEKLDHNRLFMKGTRAMHPRCIALQGSVGKQVYCAIYDRRSSVCREFPVAWENGIPNKRCDKARIAWGLAPLTPSTSDNPDNFEKVA